MPLFCFLQYLGLLIFIFLKVSESQSPKRQIRPVRNRKRPAKFIDSDDDNSNFDAVSISKKVKEEEKGFKFLNFFVRFLLYFLYTNFFFQKVEVSKAKTNRLASEKNQAKTNQFESGKNQKYWLKRRRSLPCSQDHFSCIIMMTPKRTKKVCKNLSFPNMKL